jgi:hypothetical protein
LPRAASGSVMKVLLAALADHKNEKRDVILGFRLKRGRMEANVKPDCVKRSEGFVKYSGFILYSIRTVSTEKIPWPN